MATPPPCHSDRGELKVEPQPVAEHMAPLEGQRARDALHARLDGGLPGLPGQELAGVRKEAARKALLNLNWSMLHMRGSLVHPSGDVISAPQGAGWAAKMAMKKGADLAAEETPRA